MNIENHECTHYKNTYVKTNCVQLHIRTITILQISTNNLLGFMYAVMFFC